MRAKIAIALVVVLMLSLTACGTKEGLVGTWVDKVNGVENIFEFKNDGSGAMTVEGLMSIDFKYVDKGDEFVLTVAGQEVVYKYTIDGDTLVITVNGSSETFTRK